MINRFFRVITVGAAMLLLAAACQADEGIKNPAALAPVLAPSSDLMITLGDIDSDEPIKKIKRFQPLADYLARELGDMGIQQGKVVIAQDMPEMAQFLKEGKVDFYFDSSFPTLTVQEMAGSQVIARRWKQGSASYWTTYIALRGSGIDSVDDFAGKVLAFEEPHSTSGYVLPAGTMLAACPSNTGERLLRVGWRPIHREEIRLSKTFRPYQPDQMLLMPVALQEWLPPDHLAYFISDVVDQLDLGEIESRYKQEERGYPPYHPVMMVKVLVYAYCVGVPSSRRIEKRLHEDIAFRVLAANNTPDFRTISDFRKDHLVALGGLFLKVLELCQQAGLAKLGHVSLDGTKMKANASKHKAMSYGRMKEKRVRLEAEVEELLKRAQQVDEEEDQRYGKDRRGDELPAELAFRESRLKKIREAQAALEEEAQAHGKEVPEDKSQRNFTDPDSRIMPGPGGKEFHQSYNCQAAVDSAHQVIVAADVTKQPSDHGWALPLVQQIENNTGSLPKEASADAGYYSAQAVAELYALGVDPFIPPDKTRHGTVLPPAPRGRIPGHLSPADRMRRKLRTQRGKRRYALRMGTVEPVFGQIKQARGFRQFLLRGLEKVRQEWRLICAGHNLLKLFAALRGSRCRQGAPAVA